MIKYIDGDLLKLADEGQFDVIGHCCNSEDDFMAFFITLVMLCIGIFGSLGIIVFLFKVFVHC